MRLTNLIVAIITLLLAPRHAFGGGPVTYPCEDRVKACSGALIACVRVVEEQDQAITNLKKQVSTLQDKLASSPSQGIPTWAIIATSVAAGLAVGIAIGH